MPKPLQQPHPPLWVAARAPITYDFAVKHGLNIMSWPLTRPMSEAELYKSRLDEAMANNPGKPKPIFSMMRHTALYDRKDDWMVPVKAAQRQLGQFENLFKNLGDVVNGFPKQLDFSEIANRAEYEPKMLSTNLMFGTPDEVIEKLKPYQALGVDEFTYYASLGLGLKEQKRSLELFCKHVIPAFTNSLYGSLMVSHVEVTRNGHVLEVKLNKPKVNAIDHAMSREMGEAFKQLREDPDLRVGIITAEGSRIFSAGWDLKALNSGDIKLDNWWEDGDYGEGGFAGVTENWKLNKPVIAALNGLTIGGGFEIAMACDLIIAADHVEFSLPEMPLGIVP